MAKNKIEILNLCPPSPQDSVHVPVFLSSLYIKLAQKLLNRLIAILEGQEAWPHVNHSELSSYTPSAATNQASPGKLSPRWFLTISPEWEP